MNVYEKAANVDVSRININNVRRIKRELYMLRDSYEFGTQEYKTVNKVLKDVIQKEEEIVREGMSVFRVQTTMA